VNTLKGNRSDPENRNGLGNVSQIPTKMNLKHSKNTTTLQFIIQASKMLLRYSTAILSLCFLVADSSSAKVLRGRPSKAVECTPYELLGAPEDKNEQEISKWVCESHEEDEPSGTPLVYDIEGLEPSFFKNEGVASGKDSITIKAGKKSRGGGKPDKIIVEREYGVTVNRGRGNSGRRLAAKTGASKVLVIRVTTLDSTPERTATELANDCFGIANGGAVQDTIQLKSQFDACSGGKFKPGPAANNVTAGIIDGVVDVTINITATGVLSYNTVENAARTAATNKVGALTKWNLVMFTWTKLADWQGAAAYAYRNGYISCYRDNRIWMMGVQVHEITRECHIANLVTALVLFPFAHTFDQSSSLTDNLGAKHSGENVTYDDWTCLMGNVRLRCVWI
jgi:hypothetical protein